MLMRTGTETLDGTCPGAVLVGQRPDVWLGLPVWMRPAVAKELQLMAVGTFDLAPAATGLVPTRKKPGHFVALYEEDRIDAMLAQGGVKLADTLEKRGVINVSNARRGPNDFSAPLEPANSVKSVDPHDITIAMPAQDGEPVVTDADRDAWSRFRVAYDVTLEAPPFKISGILLLLPSQDPTLLTERGSELFLAVLAPKVQIGATVLGDIPSDAILVNRSHLRRVTATMRP